MPDFFGEVLEECRREEFIKELVRHYHYVHEDVPTLKKVLDEIVDYMRKDACWAHQIYPKSDGTVISKVAMTLGAGVDCLQDSFLEREELSEAYMVETIGSNLLLLGYRAYNRWIAENTPYAVKRYYFLGDGDYSMEELPKLLADLEVPVRCNEAFSMLPKKSVAFYALLAEEKDTECEGICTGCGSVDCPNRMEETTGKWNFADMTDRPLPYGYQKIFGRK